MMKNESAELTKIPALEPAIKDSPSEKVASVFPTALTNAAFVDNLTFALHQHGFSNETTLVATSLCCDEVNRDLEKDLKHAYGDHFSMGGLAGFPFGGVTAFCAMAHHIPTNGNCIVLFGPHVGVDSDGVVGKVNRRGRLESGACCGSATAAADYVHRVCRGDCAEHCSPVEALDAQQTFVGNILLPYGTRLAEAADPAVELPLALYDAQKDLMARIVARGVSAVGENVQIALVGGIQVNTPAGTPDYFVPMTFDLLDHKGEKMADLMDTLFLVRDNENELTWIIALVMYGLVIFYLL